MRSRASTGGRACEKATYFPSATNFPSLTVTKGLVSVVRTVFDGTRAALVAAGKKNGASRRLMVERQTMIARGRCREREELESKPAVLFIGRSPQVWERAQTRKRTVRYFNTLNEKPITTRTRLGQASDLMQMALIPSSPSFTSTPPPLLPSPQITYSSPYQSLPDRPE